MKGLRVAVAGLGVSGVAAAKAVQQLGGIPVALDEKQADTPARIRNVEELQALGIEVVTGWPGRLDPQEFDVLVVSPGFPRSHPALGDMASREIWGEIELAYRIAKAPILAVTGTNGKSTTVVLAWLMLKSAGVKARLCGNISGSGYPEMTLTQAALEAGADEFLVAEVSSFQLENVDQFCPRAAAITNITPDHLDRHPSFEDYRETKLKLFAKMGLSSTAIVNLGDPSLPLSDVRNALLDDAEVRAFDPFGVSPGRGCETRRLEDAVSFSGLILPLSEFPVQGGHFVSNAMMAWELASVAAELGETSLQALRDFQGLANRMEKAGEKNGILAINNSMCTNPAAVIASSSALPQRQNLLIGGNTKGLDFSPLKNYLEGSAHRVYLFGPNPERMNEALGGGWPIFGSMPDAFRAAAREAVSGEVVMLAPGCASAEPYTSFRERGEAFRQIAKEWLDEEGE